MKFTGWIGFGWALGLALFLTACSGDAAAEKWQIDRSKDGAACHVRPVRGGTALPEAAKLHARYSGRLEACQAALALSQDPERPCLVFSDAAQQACASGVAAPGSSTLVPPGRVILPTAILMERLTTGAKSLNGFGTSRPLMIGPCTSEETFPAAFVFPFFENGESKFCTANLVGPRAMITAKHCVPDPTARYVVFLDQKIRASGSPTHTKLKCERSDTVELAICAPELPTDEFSASHYEKVGIADPGEHLFAAGFGAPTTDRLLGSKAGFFTAPVSLGASASAQGSLMTLKSKNPVLVGDSGGPVLDSCNPSRTIVGFIEGNIGTSKKSNATQNSATAVAMQLKTWANDNNHSICGLTHPPLACKTLNPKSCQEKSCSFPQEIRSTPAIQSSPR